MICSILFLIISLSDRLVNSEPTSDLFTCAKSQNAQQFLIFQILQSILVLKTQVHHKRFLNLWNAFSADWIRYQKVEKYYNTLRKSIQKTPDKQRVLVWAWNCAPKLCLKVSLWKGTALVAFAALYTITRSRRKTSLAREAFYRIAAWPVLSRRIYIITLFYPPSWYTPSTKTLCVHGAHAILIELINNSIAATMR